MVTLPILSGELLVAPALPFGSMKIGLLLIRVLGAGHYANPVVVAAV
jgi:hypothetical protein